MTSQSIVKSLLESEDESPQEAYDRIKASILASAPRELDCNLRSSDGQVLHRWHNLAGIRAHTGRNQVTKVSIREFNDMGGLLRIEFRGGDYFETNFAGYSVLKMCLRQWRNLYGAELEVEGQQAGRINYQNPALQDSIGESSDESPQETYNRIKQSIVAGAESRRERWVFTEYELANPEECACTDEFHTGALRGDIDSQAPEDCVVVRRDGSLTNRWADGTFGVPTVFQDIAMQDDCLYKPGEQLPDYYAEIWKDVYYDEAGKFVRFADPDQL